MVSYEYEGQHAVYKGIEESEGHFRLSKRGGGGRATLHAFRDDDEMEGFWDEGGYFGFWGIRLSD